MAVCVGWCWVEDHNLHSCPGADSGHILEQGIGSVLDGDRLTLMRLFEGHWSGQVELSSGYSQEGYTAQKVRWVPEERPEHGGPANSEDGPAS